MKVGELLGKYRIEGEIASGGMGVIYRAIHPVLGRPAAIKVLHAQFSGDPAFTARFVREARAMARLDHENIIRVFDVAEDQGLSYIVMELFDGKDLKRLIQLERRLLPERAMKIALQVARALGYAHSRGIVHRDIKPANILVDDLGNVKITDFGIVAAKGEASMTATGDLLGTPIYMSPEQARGDQQDGRTDLYSLGMVMYEMLSGQNPYRGMSQLAVVRKLAVEEEETPFSFPADVPVSLQETIRALLKKRIADRTPDAATLIKQIKIFRPDRDDSTEFEMTESLPSMEGRSAPTPDDTAIDLVEDPIDLTQLERSVTTRRPEPTAPEPRSVQPGWPAAPESQRTDLQNTKAVPIRVLPYVAGGVGLILVVAAAFYTLSRPVSKGEEPAGEKRPDFAATEAPGGEREAIGKYPAEHYIVAVGKASVTGDAVGDREKATRQAMGLLSGRIKIDDATLQKIAREAMIDTKAAEEGAVSALNEVVQKVDLVNEEPVDGAYQTIAVLERSKGIALLSKKIEALSQVAREKRRQADGERASGNITTAIHRLLDEKNAAITQLLFLGQLERIAGSLPLPKIEAPSLQGVFTAIEAILVEENGLQVSRYLDEKGGAAAVRLTYLKKPVADFPVRFISSGGGEPFENEGQTDRNGIAKMKALPCNNSRTILSLSAAPAYQKLLGQDGDSGYKERLDRLAETKRVGIQEIHYPCADTCDLIGREKGERTPVSLKPAGGERIDAELNKYDFRKGEAVQVRVDVKADSYLYLFNLYQDRSLTLLYPNRFYPENFLESSDRFVFPDDQAQKGVKLRVYPSEGASKSVEKIMILATEKPLDLSQAAIRQAFQIYKAEETGTIERLTGLASLSGTAWTERSLTYCVRDGI